MRVEEEESTGGRGDEWEHLAYCPNCGARLHRLKCKARCPRCAFFQDCSDTIV
jgi:hypothetical protein